MDFSSNVRMYAWVRPPPPPPPPHVSANFFPYFFHRFSHNHFFHLHSTTVRRVGGGGARGGKASINTASSLVPYINIVMASVCLYVCLFALNRLSNG